MSEKYYLLIPPLLIPVAGFIALSIITKTSISLRLLLFGMIAALINVVPFVILQIIHSHRISGKTGSQNYSFIVSYISAISTMVVAILLLLKEAALGRPGSQFVAVGFIFMFNITVPVMLISYVTGWFVERCIRKHNRVYIDEKLSHETSRRHFSKWETICIFAATIIFMLILWVPVFRLLNATGLWPAPDIYCAAEWGSIRQVKQFINKGADVNARNEDGDTPLHLAAFCGSKELIELLAANGAVVDAKNNIGKTPLFNAAWAGKTTAVSSLIEHGADVSARDKHSDIPLHEAVRKGHKNIAKILITHGADVNVQNNLGQTPLMKAVFWGYKDLTELLIEQGADVNIADKKGKTPLSVAIEEKYKGIEELLRQHGATEPL